MSLANMKPEDKQKTNSQGVIFLRRISNTSKLRREASKLPGNTTLE
jgi:hypothetical protein